MRSIRRLQQIAWAALGLLVAGAASANAPPDITAEESALLPYWCNYVQMGQGKDFRRIYNLMVAQYGDGWTHMHHYCWALVDILRIDRFMAQQRPGYAMAGRALGNIDYVLQNTERQPDFAFRPELLARKARLLARNPDLGPALQVARKLLAEWPKLPDGYILLAQLLLRAGDSVQARSVLSRAEAEVEDKAALAQQRRLLALD